MKTLLLTVLTLMTGMLLQGQVNVQQDSTDGGGIVKDSDTTIIEIPGFKIVIRESDDDNVEVKVEKEKNGQIIFDEKIEGDDAEDLDLDFSDLKNDKELKDAKTRFLLLELGINGYFNNQGGLNAPIGYSDLELQYSKSINVNLHLFRQRINLIQHHVNFTYGMGFEFSDYRFANNVTWTAQAPELTIEPLDEPLKKSKLATTFLNLPLMLNFETNPEEMKRSFHLSAGGYAGILLGARTKYKTTNNKKVKERDDFNLNHFRYGLTGSIGYGWFNLYANYALSEMFVNNEGPVLNPWNVGIVLIGF